ncbi:hypothetical protein BKX95_07995 [Streptococcus iniae]|nr:hypothetical protein BKX95_07995 [Streptococcus iniae]
MGTNTFTGGWGGNLTIEIISAWNSQNTVGNYSTVNVQVFLRMSSYGMISLPENRPLKITVDGWSETVNINTSIREGQYKQILAKDYRVNHNSDGSKPQFNISAYLPINFSNYGEASVSEPIRLPTIKRASTSSAISGTLGSAVAINVTRQDASFKHTIKYDFKGTTGTIATGVDTSYSWTLPTSFASLMPNELTGTGTFTVETYSGSSKIGENKYSLSVSVPDNATYKPKLTSISLSDANTSTGSLITGNNFVRILSNVKVSFSGATGSNGATIVGYRAEIVGKGNVTTANGGTLGMMDYVGSATVRATVTDSRGLTSAPVDVSINVIDYFLPIATNFKVTRAKSNPNILQLSPIVKIAPLMVGGIQKNQLKLKVEVAPYDNGVFVTDNGAATNTWTTVSSFNGELLNLGGTYDKSKSWIVRIVLSDSLMPASPVTQTISSEFALMTKAPTGVAFGKVWERGIIDAEGDVYISGKTETKSLTVDGFAISKLALLNMMYPIGSIFISTSSANPSTTMGGTWVRYAQGQTIVGVNENDSDFNTVGKTGGAKTHTLTVNELPAHQHDVNTEAGTAGNASGWQNVGSVMRSAQTSYTQGVKTNSVGGGQAHNNMQPYITTYIWLRTA